MDFRNNGMFHPTVSFFKLTNDIVKIITPFLFLFVLLSCSKSEDKIDSSPAENLADHIHKPGVMMQAFYWDVEPRGDWWNEINTKLTAWKQAGITRIWLPPASKGMSGPFSMGYDPFDYFDFGEFDQMGTIETRFGSRTELENLISQAHTLGMEVMADIVLNHNSGGDLEFNPFRQKDTYTDFKPLSGKFDRSFGDFHPNAIHEHDEGALFFEEQDLCHHQENVKNWFWENDNSVAKYYKEVMHFDGWRFDYVKGFSPDVIPKFMASAGGFGVLEVWDGNAELINSWVEATGISAFDFAAFYAMENAFDGSDLRILVERPQLWKMNPEKAVTFVNNHDTYKDTNEGNRISSEENSLLAYAYMLTHEGLPSIFYLDYEELLDKNKLDKLIEINRSLAVGETRILEASRGSYISQRAGNDQVPGLILSLNNSASVQKKTIRTQWPNAVLFNYAGYGLNTVETDADGRVTIETSAKSYAVWSLKNF